MACDHAVKAVLKKALTAVDKDFRGINGAFYLCQCVRN